MHVLFVCTGNICRSPTAERLAVSYSAAHGIRDFTAASAGTHAVIGHPIHEHSVTVLKQLGAETANFVARQLNTKIASAADLIIAMTMEHRDAALEHAPHKLHKTFTLAEAALLATEHGARSIADLAELRPQITPHIATDILDPIGQSPEVFAQIGSQIAELLPPVLELCRPK